MRAFEQLYRAFAGDLLRRIIRPRVTTDVDAEDVLVDTFTTGLAKLHTFTWQGRSIFHWFARIAANRAMDVGRARSRQHKLTDALTTAVEAVPTTVAVAPAPSLTPAEVLLSAVDDAERRERVQAILESLNPRYRRALQERLLEGRPRQECADMLDIKLGTFDVLFLRAVRSFRKQWVARYGEEQP